jgi:hypothetical protein
LTQKGYFDFNELSGETINSEEESVSNRIRQVSPSQGPTLPILPMDKLELERHLLWRAAQKIGE